MARPYPDALSVSRKVLRALIWLNLLAGVLILALLIASVVAEGPVMGALGARPADDDSTLFQRMRLVMLLGIGSVPLAHVVLTRLLAVVDTVRGGDPFVRENAGRLQTIAWAVLGLELVHLAVGAVATFASSEAETLDLDWSFSLTRWLAVLLLFVLARVFDHGARMREDLEGTV
ncbi:MAG TPA: DUF2975 domain-containing protein [Gemmatimonadaceae bacterium]|nr:DUF2975 domain-containing protein [Gemmatimonadaceae bacterium]